MNRLILILLVVHFQSLVQGIYPPPTLDSAINKNVRASRNISIRSTEQFFLEDTVRLITEEESKTKLIQNTIKDVVLVVGMTGAGKTTITKFIAQAENLEAYKVRSSYLIRDKDREISDKSTIVSKTIFPNLIVDPKSGISFYDMPGFSDTRNVSVEIANSWFLKNVADRAERVKILLVVTHSTITQGGHRTKIIELLNHLTDFIKNPSKFQNSISLVASKVDLDDSPDRIISGIADFLQSVKNDLPKVMSNVNKRAKAAELLDAFLSTDENNQYNRISYFLQPFTAGPLTEQEDVMARRELMVRNLEVSTRFVTNSPEDFGISITDGGKLLISKIAGVMNGMISTSMISLSNQIVTHTQNNVNNPSKAAGKLQTDQRHLEDFYQSLSATMSRQEFTQALSELITTLHIPGLEPEIQRIQNRERNLNFFEAVRGEKFPVNIQQWSSPLRIAIESANSALTQMTSTLNQQMVQETQNLNTLFQSKIHQEIFNSQNSTLLKQQLSSLSESLELLIEDSHRRVDTYNQFSTTVATFLTSQGEFLRASKFENLTSDMEVEGSSCRVRSPLKLSNWLLPFEILLEILEEEQIKVDKMVLDELRLPPINQLKLAKRQAEKNFTFLITGAHHSLSVLKTQRDQEVKVFDDLMLTLKERCDRDLTNMRDLFENEESGLINYGNKSEVISYKELTMERNNTGRVEHQCIKTQNRLNITFENERQENRQSLEKTRKQRQDQSNSLKKNLEDHLQLKNESCLQEVKRRKDFCAQQQTHLKEQSEQKAQTRQNTIRLKAQACDKQISEMHNLCSRQIQVIQEQANSDKNVKENQITSEATYCESLKEIELQSCNLKMEEARANKASEDARWSQKLSHKNETCQSELKAQDALHKKAIRVLETSKTNEERFSQKECTDKVEVARDQARKNHHAKLSELKQRWIKSGACCPPINGGRCRDGVVKSGCCGSTECRTNFWGKDTCCGCSSLCRM